jgi:hypothetical protein
MCRSCLFELDHLESILSGFFCMIKGAFLESPTLGFDIEIMQDAFSPGPFSHLRRNERTFEKTADGSEDTWLHGQACF